VADDLRAADDGVLREAVRAVERVVDDERQSLLHQLELTERTGRLLGFSLAAFITIVGLVFRAEEVLHSVVQGAFAAGTLCHVGGLAGVAVGVHILAPSVQTGVDPGAIRAACADPEWSEGGLLSSLLEAYDRASRLNVTLIEAVGRRRSGAVILWICGVVFHLAGIAFILWG
jgi:hypothetical protein